MPVQRVCRGLVTTEDVIDFIAREDLFRGGAMDIQTFKRTFFPLYYQVEEGYPSDPEDLPEAGSLEAKLSRLEGLIKEKFANNWTSVRKAFLDLDNDFDGFVTAEDILRYFGKEEIDFRDLVKLIADKDCKKEGRISYTDFSKWLGGVI